jgi:hypothetical protein
METMANKTKTQVIKDNEQYKSLINAVIKQLGGTDSLPDIRNHGIDGGFSGFIYYSDTHEFTRKNRKQIVQLLEDQAEQLGEDVVSMVANFGVFRTSKMDNEDKKDLYKLLGGGMPEQGTITNLMAWFAAEEVARMFEND